ncbi:MAG: DnaB-like helicase C-terminal domain-containing protein [Thermodesulfobacteriota bacterium]|nr:DnaB-like helicase C-terminal domain-containing protein [Thermodesulfobacteriota bacterium]
MMKGFLMAPVPKSPPHQINQFLGELFEDIEKVFENKIRVRGISTGFHDLDTMTSGFKAGDLIVVAGRPAMGKTAFCTNVVEHVSIHANDPLATLIFSLEMNSKQLVLRMLSSVSMVHASSLRTGCFTDPESAFPKLTMGAGQLDNAQIFIDDTPDINIEKLCAKTRRLNAENNLGLIVIDCLQLIQSDHRAGRLQDISKTVKALKALAEELNLPIVVTSQLNGSLENRTDNRPILEDLCGFDTAFGQNVDLVIFVYRETVYCDDCMGLNRSCDKGHYGDADIIVAKQRTGPIGTLRLNFHPDSIRFSNKSLQSKVHDLLY